MIDDHPSGYDNQSLEALAKRTSDALRALSHEHRLLILALLTSRERSVGELEKLLNLPQPAVSQQLARLRHDELVLSRRDGRTIYYSLNVELAINIQRSLSTLISVATHSNVDEGREVASEAVIDHDEARLTA